MAFSLGGLTTWVNDNSQELLAAAVLKGETIDLISLKTGVKYKERLKYLATDAVFQAGGCGYSTNGNVVITEKDLYVVDVKINESLCPEDLNEYSLSLSLRPGYNKDIPFAQMYMDQKTKEINKTIETNLWGTTGSTTAPLGLQYLVTNDGSCYHTHQNLTGATTASEWLSIVYAMQVLLPEEIQSATDLTLFVSHSYFRKMVQAFVIGNFYHIDATNNNGMEPFYFPGTNIKVVAVNGLASTNFFLLTPASNLIYVTDLANEQEKIEMFWDQSDQIVKFIARFKYGVSYYFSNYIVYAIQ